MTRKLFGTNGIRGVANVDSTAGEMAMQFMLEGEEETRLHRFAKDLVELVKKHLGKWRVECGSNSRRDHAEIRC